MSTAHSLYAPIPREPSLADRVAHHLQTLIVQGALRPGDQLPPERELAQRFGVSRTAVREAVRMLTAKGLLEVRSGAGMVVRAPSVDLVSELLSICVAHLEVGDITYSHILEMRRLVEIEMAALAAERRTEVDLVALERWVEVMAQPDLPPEEWAKADVAFHNALAQASQNPLFLVVLRSLGDVLMRVRLLAVRLPETRQNALYHHRRILEAVRQQAPEAARQAMADHLREAEATQRRALAAQTDQDGPSAERERG